MSKTTTDEIELAKEELRLQNKKWHENRWFLITSLVLTPLTFLGGFFVNKQAVLEHQDPHPIGLTILVTIFFVLSVGFFVLPFSYLFNSYWILLMNEMVEKKEETSAIRKRFILPITILLGYLGIHRFSLKKYGTGITFLLYEALVTVYSFIISKSIYFEYTQYPLETYMRYMGGGYSRFLIGIGLLGMLIFIGLLPIIFIWILDIVKIIQNKFYDAEGKVIKKR